MLSPLLYKLARCSQKAPRCSVYKPDKGRIAKTRACTCLARYTATVQRGIIKFHYWVRIRMSWVLALAGSSPGNLFPMQSLNHKAARCFNDDADDDDEDGAPKQNNKIKISNSFYAQAALKPFAYVPY